MGSNICFPSHINKLEKKNTKVIPIKRLSSFSNFINLRSANNAKSNTIRRNLVYQTHRDDKISETWLKNDQHVMSPGRHRVLTTFKNKGATLNLDHVQKSDNAWKRRMKKMIEFCKVRKKSLENNLMINATKINA